MHYLFFTVITLILWASLALLVAELSHVPPFLLLACSLLIGGSFSLPKMKQWQFTPSALVVGVGGIFGYHFLLFMSLRLAPPIAANLLNYLWPLLILLLTPVFFSHIELKKKQVFGALTSLLGAMLILSQGEVAISSIHSLGYFLAILAAIVWACYSLFSKKLSGIHSASVGLFCLISGFLSLICHWCFEQTPFLSTRDISLILFLGVGPLGISFYTWSIALKRGDPRVIATLSYFTPLLSTLLLVIFTNQMLNIQLISAMVLIVMGALVANIEFKLIIKKVVRTK